MKLRDLFERHEDDEPEYDDGEYGTFDASFIIPEWDGFQPEDVIVDPFSVKVEYTAEGGGHTYHPYGEGYAKESHGYSVSVELTAASEVTVRDIETDEVVDTFPVGTELSEIPGWHESDREWFEKEALKHFEGGK